MPATRAAAQNKTRARILACGRRIVARGGVRSLTVRGVAAQARVNLGTFVYHFGTREGFVAELMESWYAPIYAQLRDLAIDDDSPPLERIRRFLLRLAGFLAANRKFVRNLFVDAAGAEESATRFIRSLLDRHPLLLFKLIREAQAAGAIRAGDPVKTGLFLVGSTLFPGMLLGVLMPERMLAGDGQGVLRDMFAPQEIERRFELALRGLAPAPHLDGSGKEQKIKGKPMNARTKKSKPAARAEVQS